MHIEDGKWVKYYFNQIFPPVILLTYQFSSLRGDQSIRIEDHNAADGIVGARPCISVSATHLRHTANVQSM